MDVIGTVVRAALSSLGLPGSPLRKSKMGQDGKRWGKGAGADRVERDGEMSGVNKCGPREEEERKNREKCRIKGWRVAGQRGKKQEEVTVTLPTLYQLLLS